MPAPPAPAHGGGILTNTSPACSEGILPPSGGLGWGLVALPGSGDPSLKPRCTRLGLWPPRHLAVLHVKSLLQPLLSNQAIFGLPAREPRSAHRSSADNPISPPCRIPSHVQPLAVLRPHVPLSLQPHPTAGAGWGRARSPQAGQSGAVLPALPRVMDLGARQPRRGTSPGYFGQPPFALPAVAGAAARPSRSLG